MYHQTGDMVSTVTSECLAKILNKGWEVSRRYVLVAQRQGFLISQKRRKLTYKREANLYKSLDCFLVWKIRYLQVSYHRV
jgi:hypothetical protein